MPYATLDDINTRYPGELTQAGPKDSTGAIDGVAVDHAIQYVSEIADACLRKIGVTVPLADPIPDWVKSATVDMALYAATPTVLASQDDFKDRYQRYSDTLVFLGKIASGELLPPIDEGLDVITGPQYTNPGRVFNDAALSGF